MPINLAETADRLEVDLLRTAAWRRKDAADPRNAEAAAALERIAKTVREVDAALLNAYRRVFEELCDAGDDGIESANAHAVLLGQVGFGWTPETATEFVSRFIAKSTGTA